MRITPQTHRRPRSARRRLALGLAVAAGTLAATASAAVAAPRMTVTPASGLDRNATNTITVSGTGFTADAVVQATGFYVSITATVDGSLVGVQTPVAKWIRADGPTPDTKLNEDGSFSTTVDVPRRVPVDSDELDCAVTQCFITAWRAHGTPATENILTSKAIVFAAAAPGTPEVTATPVANLPREGETVVTVTGTGFDPNAADGNGIYVAYGPKTPEFWREASTFGATKWVYAGAPVGPARDVLNLDGTFSTTLTISPSYTTRSGTTYDCRVIECAILTFAAHGSTDRSFDTTTPVTFAPPPPAVTVSPTTGLNRNGPTTLRVAGSNFSTGAYVSLTAIIDGRVLADQPNARWMRTRGATTPETTINPDGSFTTTLTVTPTFTADGVTVDCREVQCAISTWRQHSNPTPTTLFTSTPIAFAPVVAPPAPPAPQEPPVVEEPPTETKPAAKITPFTKAQPLRKNRIVRVARVGCGTARCTITTPKAVRVKIGKKRFRARVLAPKRIAAGKRAVVRLRLTKAGANALARRAGKATVRIVVRSSNGRVVQTAKVTIKRTKPATKRGTAKRTATTKVQARR